MYILYLKGGKLVNVGLVWKIIFDCIVVMVGVVKVVRVGVGFVDMIVIGLDRFSLDIFVVMDWVGDGYLKFFRLLVKFFINVLWIVCVVFGIFIIGFRFGNVLVIFLGVFVFVLVFFSFIFWYL